MTEMYPREFEQVEPGTTFRIVITAELTDRVPFMYIVRKGFLDDFAVYGLPVYRLLSETTGTYLSMLTMLETDGIKILETDHIKNIFPCTDEVLAKYRK